MAIGNPADIGYGLAITFSSSFFAQITDFSHTGMGRSVIDISSNASTNNWRIKLPGDLRDAGQCEVEFNFLTNNLAGAKTLITATKASCVITWPILADGGTAAGTMTVDAFASDFGDTAPMDDRMVGTCTLALSGEPTFVNAT